MAFTRIGNIQTPGSRPGTGLTGTSHGDDDDSVRPGTGLSGMRPGTGDSAGGDEDQPLLLDAPPPVEEEPTPRSIQMTVMSRLPNAPTLASIANPVRWKNSVRLAGADRTLTSADLLEFPPCHRLI